MRATVFDTVRKRKIIKRQVKALKQMQDIFTDTVSCAGIKCKECIFGMIVCDKLNVLKREYSPYQAHVSLENLDGKNQ